LIPNAAREGGSTHRGVVPNYNHLGLVTVWHVVHESSRTCEAFKTFVYIIESGTGLIAG
jgi:hypothetical protein